MPLIISKERCPQNHACPLLNICPVGAITQEGYALPVIDTDSCVECGACIDNCGMGAVKMKEKI